MSKVGIDVTKEYLEGAAPKTGAVIRDSDYNDAIHAEEVKVAEWLRDTLGDDIQLLHETSNEYWRKTADYLWKGRLWELKTVGSVKAVDKALRKGIGQIKPNPGGVIIDFGSNAVTPSNAESIIEKRINTSAGFGLDVMILHNKKLVKVIRYK